MRLRKYFKTALSAMLAATMVVTSVPANTAYAATVGEETTQQSPDNEETQQQASRS